MVNNRSRGRDIAGLGSSNSFVALGNEELW